MEKHSIILGMILLLSVILIFGGGFFGVDEATVDSNFEPMDCIYDEDSNDYYTTIEYTRGFTRYIYCDDNNKTIMVSEKR